MKYWLSLVLVIIFISCQPYAKTNRFYRRQAKDLSKIIRQAPLKDSFYQTGKWVGTTNFNLRKPNHVIIHHTAQNSCEQTLKTFTNQKTSVSAHYVICRNGTVHHMLNDYLRAWHGGVAKWGSISDINSSSIGIELDNNGSEPFAEAQISSLLQLLGTLKKTYNIPVGNFIGHADIAPVRKGDPSVYFPWKTLAENGFGHWYYDTTGVEVPSQFNSMEALRWIGYNIKDSAAVTKAFKLHFMQDTTAGMNEAAAKILFTLYKKYE